jgi:hypothetical protein
VRPAGQVDRNAARTHECRAVRQHARECDLAWRPSGVRFHFSFLKLRLAPKYRGHLHPTPISPAASSSPRTSAGSGLPGPHTPAFSCGVRHNDASRMPTVLRWIAQLYGVERTALEGAVRRAAENNMAWARGNPDHTSSRNLRKSAGI